MLDFMAQQSLQVYMLSQEIRFKDLQTAMDNVKDHDFRPSFATIGNLLKNEYHVFEKFERWNFSKKLQVFLKSLYLGQCLSQKFDDNTLTWFESYLFGHTQQVFIDGSFSGPMENSKSSTRFYFGPSFVHLFYNDLPEGVHDHLASSQTLFNGHC